jgi:hypothetical protein
MDIACMIDPADRTYLALSVKIYYCPKFELWPVSKLSKTILCCCGPLERFSAKELLHKRYFVTWSSCLGYMGLWQIKRKMAISGFEP